MLAVLAVEQATVRARANGVAFAGVHQGALAGSDVYSP
jgi:hypothetical protein